MFVHGVEIWEEAGELVINKMIIKNEILKLEKQFLMISMVIIIFFLFFFGGVNFNLMDGKDERGRGLKGSIYGREFDGLFESSYEGYQLYLT